MTLIALWMLGAGLAAPLPDGIVCDSRQVPVQISRTVYVLEHQTRCYALADRERGVLDRLRVACDLLLTAYGEEDGRRRCQDLIAHSELSPPLSP